MCLIAGLLFFGVTAQAATTLTSVETDKPVLLSGTADDTWKKASPLKVTLQHGPGFLLSSLIFILLNKIIIMYSFAIILVNEKRTHELP